MSFLFHARATNYIDASHRPVRLRNGIAVARYIGFEASSVQGEERPVNGKTVKGSANSVRDVTSNKKASPPRAEKKGDVGNALRSIYQQTVDEAIPSEMLDLLGKLG